MDRFGDVHARTGISGDGAGGVDVGDGSRGLTTGGLATRRPHRGARGAAPPGYCRNAGPQAEGSPGDRHRYPGIVRHQLVELGYLKRRTRPTADSVAFNVQPRRTGRC